MDRNRAAATVPELSGEGTVGWEVGCNGEIVCTIRGARQHRKISDIYPMRAARNLGDWNLMDILLFCDTGSCSKLV